MRNLFLGIILFFGVFQQIWSIDIKVWNIKNTNLTIVFPTAVSDNSVIWMVQGTTTHSSETITTYSNANISFHTNHLKLNSEIVFLLVGNEMGEHIANSYGLVKFQDNNLLNSLIGLNENTKIEVIDDISAKADCKQTGTTHNCKCSGGPGSTECGCGGGIGVASWSESVSCGEGYYACCTGLKLPDDDGGK